MRTNKYKIFHWNIWLEISWKAISFQRTSTFLECLCISPSILYWLKAQSYISVTCSWSFYTSSRRTPSRRPSTTSSPFCPSTFLSSFRGSPMPTSCFYWCSRWGKFYAKTGGWHFYKKRLQFGIEEGCDKVCSSTFLHKNLSGHHVCIRIRQQWVTFVSNKNKISCCPKNIIIIRW